jgi:hypothetical protein
MRAVLRIEKLLKHMGVKVEVTGGSFKFVAAHRGGLSAYPLDLSQRIEPDQIETAQMASSDSAIVWREPESDSKALSCATDVELPDSVVRPSDLIS